VTGLGMGDNGKGEAANYVIRVHRDPGEIDPAAWNRLLAEQASPTPFLRHEFLALLHQIDPGPEICGSRDDQGDDE